MANLKLVNFYRRIMGYKVETGVGSSPLHYSCMSNNLEVIQLLLEEEKKHKVNLRSMRDTFGMTPLFYTCSSEAVQLFLSSGLKGLELFGSDGWTFLQYCIRRPIPLLTYSIWSALESQWEMTHSRQGYRGKTAMEMGED